MIESLLVSNAILWVVVLALAGVILALVRQIGVLHERLAPAGALMIGRGPKVGDQVPVLDVDDLQGVRHRVGVPDAAGQGTLLLFVSPTCPVCESLLPVARAIERREGVRLVLASDGPRDEHQAFVHAHRLGGTPYLLSTELGVTYQVSKLPFAVLIDGDGVLRGKGLVNSREHLESLFEARERGVASIQEYARDHAVRVEAARKGTRA
jgi:methylamine dehydrogenase accessory protein MauD